MTPPIGLTDHAEVIPQPYGAFLANRRDRRFDVVNRVAAALLLRLRNPTTEEELFSWAAAKGMVAQDIEHFLDCLRQRGYIGVPSVRPTISFAPEASVLKAVRAEVEITNRCNLRCAYCYAEANRSKTDLSADRWIDILEGMYSHGLRAALFSGGEPFLHREFDRILSWAASRLIIEVNSNGTYISDEVAARLREYDLKLVQISVDSPSSEHHDSVRGAGSHARAVRAVERLVKHGVPTQISAVVTASNRAFMPEMVAFAARLGAQFQGNPVARTGFAREITGTRWEEDFAVSSRERHSSPNEEAKIGFEPVCQSQVGFVAVSHQGILKPCNMRERFFEPTGTAFLVDPADAWWEKYYGQTRVARSATSVQQVSLGRASDPETTSGEYPCKLQLALALASASD